MLPLQLPVLLLASSIWKEGRYREPQTVLLSLISPKEPQRPSQEQIMALWIDVSHQLPMSYESIQGLGGLLDTSGYPIFSEAFLNYLQRLNPTTNLSFSGPGQLSITTDAIAALLFSSWLQDAIFRNFDVLAVLESSLLE